MAYIEQMEGQMYIDSTREYLDYIENHLNNVSRAFTEISKACSEMTWVSDDYSWHSLRREVEIHDLSKFSPHEFTQYRDAFFPPFGNKKKPLGSAWEHHKQCNHHHWETIENHTDLVHMVIDWTAMSYEFGGSAQEYYEKNKDRIRLTEHQVIDMYEIFDNIRVFSTENK